MIWKTVWSTQGNECSETKDRSNYLLPASYEKEWLENIVTLCRELKTGEMVVKILWRESLLCVLYLFIFVLFQLNLTVGWGWLIPLCIWEINTGLGMLSHLLWVCSWSLPPLHQLLLLWQLGVITLIPVSVPLFFLSEPRGRWTAEVLTWPFCYVVWSKW